MNEFSRWIKQVTEDALNDKFRAKRIRRIVFSSWMVFLLLSLAVLHFFPHTGSIQEAVQTFLWVCAFCWMGVYVPEIPEKYWYPTVFGLLAIPFFTLFFGSAALLCGLSLNRLWLLCAIALTVWLVKRLSLPGTLKFTLPCIFGIWLTVTFFASLTLDFSYEGESVQKPMTILLSQGWNPIYTPCSVFLEEKGIDPASFDSAGAAFYPKGQAVISAVYADFFGNIEAGDGVYFLMIPCCIFLFYNILKKQLNFGKYETLMLTAILTLSPTLLCGELFSGSIGGPLALMWTLFLLASWSCIRTGNKRLRPVVVASCVYGCTLQFSAVLFFGTVIGIYSLTYILPRFFRPFLLKEHPETPLWKERFAAIQPQLPLRTWCRTLGFIAFFLLICGFHPYVTNTVTRFSPFYPCATFFPNAFPIHDVMEPYFLNPNFKNGNAYNRFVFCNLDSRRPVRPGESVGALQDARRVEIFSLFSRRPFGIFPFVLFTAIPLLFFVRRWDSWFVLSALLAGFFLYPYNWNEIFTPQIRVFPILVLAFVMFEFRAGKTSSETFLERRGTLLFRTVIFCLFWSSIVSFGWVCTRHTQLAAQCSKMNIMLNTSDNLTLCPVWEFSAEVTPEKETIAFPRPVTPFYFQTIFTPQQLNHLKFQEASELIPQKKQNQFYIHTLCFLTPAEEEYGRLFDKIPINQGSCYKQCVLRTQQFLFQRLPKPQSEPKPQTELKPQPQPKPRTEPDRK